MVYSQNCTVILKGKVADLSSLKPLNQAHVYLQEKAEEWITDSSGIFIFSGLCAGNYHLNISHFGCETQTVFITLKADTFITLFLDHEYHVTKKVAIKGKGGAPSIQSLERLSEQNIFDNAHKNLSNQLENLSGVSVLRNGNGIAKPIVHGLYGNRLTILNNGIAQSGQQWGNDHSPEIDPLSANRISVIKGVSALAYPGANLGAVILIEPNHIQKEPHLHGKSTYFYASNGRANGVNLQFQQGGEKLAWRLNTTAKMAGDLHTPSYFLTNTGAQELNASLQLEKHWSPKKFSSLYISSFNANLGVLRGAHIGNLTDLQVALEKDTPFFTQPAFSYGMEAPKQQVNHQLAKFFHKQFKNDSTWTEITYAFQWNLRKEFDVRRSGRSENAALNLSQFTHFGELKRFGTLKKQWQYQTGVQLTLTDNTNDPTTGILPLIPDYFAVQPAAFLVFNKPYVKSEMEFGLRYDGMSQNVAAISTSFPRIILRSQNQFHNLGASAGWMHRFKENYSLNANIGLANRNPAINELFSGGLHQGVSGIELGNLDLKSEQGLKSTFSFAGRVKEKFSFEVLAYGQWINNYIFLAPQNQFFLTIRGAFPLFIYTQTDARIIGTDVQMDYKITPFWRVKYQLSYLHGTDLSNGIPLIFMPPLNTVAALCFNYPKHLHIGKTALENTSISFTNRYVFRQNNLLLNQDFAPAPNAYYLAGLQLSSDIQIRKTQIHLFFNLDNMFNAQFRDYLNRQRYFADDIGRNITLGASVSF